MIPLPARGIAGLQALYARDADGPERVLRAAHEGAARSPEGVWIHRATLAELLAELHALTARKQRGETLPLFGIPFAVKDNIDVAGMPTTAACPAFSHVPERSAFVVDRLRSLGAIAVGKTNLDQFATGLVGVRSPYGIPKNPFDPRYVTGGSSSGSAVAVSLGQVTFALGTDTAGSGRVPAAFNHIVGLKPTRGALSTRGVVPACASLDCVSIFAASSEDALALFDVAAAFDPADPFSRRLPSAPPLGEKPRVGVPRREHLDFCSDADAERLYDGALAALTGLGAAPVEIDFAPFRDAALLLYSGPWVAERLQAAGELLESNPAAIHPVVRSILESARGKTALDAFRGQYDLARLARAAETEWQKMDVLLLPTTPTIFTVDAVEKEPILLNSKLGTYTNFVNLLDLAAIAVPAGFRADGLPLGVTLLGRAGTDRSLAKLAARLHRAVEPTSLACRAPLPPPVDSGPTEDGTISIAVLGAHLHGEPLHHQLVERGARLVRVAKTARGYRFFALAGTTPPKPGLALERGFEGPGIELEIYALPPEHFATFVAAVPAPLAVGTLELDDGTSVKGFVCEPAGLVGATEITHHGGWRAYLQAGPAR